MRIIRIMVNVLLLITSIVWAPISLTIGFLCFDEFEQARKGNSFLLLLMICFISACSAPIVVEKKTIDVNTEIKNIVNGSSCSLYKFKDRGYAPKDYLETIAKIYHKESCAKKELPSNGGDKDALAWYGLSSNLRNTYTFLIGLGMRESSGKHCAGRDSSATNIDALTAEAGLFQFSYNSINASPRLKEIYSSHSKCESRPCLSKNWGTGPGVEFQRIAKECPEFSVEYAAHLIRVLRKHFGPIGRKEVEFIPACGEMLDRVSNIDCQ